VSEAELQRDCTVNIVMARVWIVVSPAFQISQLATTRASRLLPPAKSPANQSARCWKNPLGLLVVLVAERQAAAARRLAGADRLLLVIVAFLLPLVHNEVPHLPILVLRSTTTRPTARGK
jgi:hypothetical protein